MLRKFFKRFVPKSHYWRNIGFDELSEVYASQLMRSLALSLVNIFVPVYLYMIGFSLRYIFVFFLVWFLVRLPLLPLWALLIGRIGPKHGITISMLIQMVYLAMLLTMESLHWPLLLLSAVGSAAVGLYWISFHTDLSKIKHNDHAGKELSFVNIFERVGAIAGPLVGGLIANFFDPRYTIFLALIVMGLSVVPLLMTKEPVKTKQKITFRGFPYRKNLRTSLSVSAFDLDTQSSQAVWPLYVAVFIFGSDVFGKLGLMAGLSVAVGLMFAKAIGKIVDTRRSGDLFHMATWANSVVYLVRPFITSITGVFGLNFVNDPVTTAFRISFLKGYYADADSMEGYRIVYFSVNEFISACFRALFWGCLVAFTFVWPVEQVMRWQFAVLAIATLALLLQRFPALVRSKA